MRRRFGAIAAVLFVAGCAGPRLPTGSPKLPTDSPELPTGVGTPSVADTVRFVDAISKQCAELDSWTGTIALDGMIGRRSVHRELLGAFTRPNVRLEAASLSAQPPLVVLSDGTKTILRSSRGTFEVGDSRDVIKAIIGVRMRADVLGRTLMGCELPDGFSTLRMFGPLWARLPLLGGSIYLHRSDASAPWQLVTLFYPGDTLHWAWRVDFEDVQNGIPLRSHLVSADGHTDMHFKLSQVDTMVVFPSDDIRFRIDRSPDARRGTSEQLNRIVDQWLGAD